MDIDAIGPSLGGFLSQHYGWRSVFFVNVPIGLVSLYLAAAHMPRIRQMHVSKMRLDWRGALLIALALGALQQLVEALGNQPIGARSLMYMATVLISLVLLVREELHAENPIIPPDMLHDRGLVVLLLLSVMMGIALFSLLVYVPLLLQAAPAIHAAQALASAASRLNNPQTLINADAASDVVAELAKAGFDGHALLALARVAMTHAIELAFGAVATSMVLATLGVAFLPMIKLRVLNVNTASRMVEK